MAGLTSIHEVAALFSPKRIAFKSRLCHHTVFSAKLCSRATVG